MIERFESFRPVVPASTYVHPLASVIGDVVLGEQCTIWPGVSLRGDHAAIRIGARTSIQDGTVGHTTGGLSELHVGSDCTIGHRVILHGCRVDHHVLVGMGAILLDNAEIGPYSLVGAGALVTQRKKFPGGVLILGNPAKIVRELTPEERASIDASVRTYLDYGARFLAPGAVERLDLP